MSLLSSLSLRSFRNYMLLPNKFVQMPPKCPTRNKMSIKNCPPESLRNVDLAIKMGSSEEQQENEEELFKTLNELGIETHDKIHSFNFSSNQAIKFIKLGIINKYMAAQYCHYVTHLSRTLGGKLSAHYGSRALDIALFLVRRGDGLTDSALSKILIDVCDISSQNCLQICELLLSKPDLTDKLNQFTLSKFLSACYKYKLWPQATELIEVVKGRRILSPLFIDKLVLGICESAEEFNSTPCTNEKEKIKKEVFNHLFILFDKFYEERVQFITKFQLELRLAFEQFGVEIRGNSEIKKSICTSCNSKLPEYDESSTQALNSILKNLLYGRVTGELNLNSESRDLENFEQFISDLINKDGKPIDIVIDGLNIAYKNTQGFLFHRLKLEDDLTKTHKFHNSKSQVQALITTILRSKLLKTYRKILVIGKSHMLKWPGLIQFFDKNNIHYFLSGNSAKDDLFQLYAATFHPKTILATSDFFRDHLALLNGTERFMLERWIDTHQAWAYSKKFYIVFPTPYEKLPSVNKSEGIFHIPIIDPTKLANIALHEPPPHLNAKMIDWICGKMNYTEGNVVHK